MIDDDGTLYVLILTRSSPKPLREISRLVATELHRPFPDVLSQLRYGGGLVAEDLTASQAEAAERTLKDAGVSVKAVSAADWLAPVQGFRVTQLECTDAAVQAGLSTGRQIEVPVSALHGMDLYGLVPAESERETSDSMTRVPMELSNVSDRAKKLLKGMAERDLANMEFFLTLYCDEPSRALRIRRDEFLYVGLGEKKMSHSLDNFLLLVEQVVELYPKLWNNDKAVQFLDELNPENILYYKREEAQNFDRWMLQWVRIEEGGAQAKPADDVDLSAET